jgi:hypothetical protein
MALRNTEVPPCELDKPGVFRLRARARKACSLSLTESIPDPQSRPETFFALAALTNGQRKKAKPVGFVK